MVICAGDSLMSPHFYSSSGLTTGAGASDFITKAIGDYQKGLISSKADFIKQLDKNLRLVAQASLRESSSFLVSRAAETVRKETCAKVLRQVEDLYEQTHLLCVQDRGYRVASVDREKKTFELEYIDRTEKIKKDLVVLNKEGKLFVRGKKVYYKTIKAMILTLQVR